MAKYTAEERMATLELLAKKELLLNDVVMWLKTKGLWKQFQQESGWNIEETPVQQPAEEQPGDPS